MVNSRRVALIVASYCAANVCLLVAYAMSLLGPVSFALIYSIAFASIAAAVILPVVLWRRIGALYSMLCAAALAAVCVFDVWCLFVASAAI